MADRKDPPIASKASIPALPHSKPLPPAPPSVPSQRTLPLLSSSAPPLLSTTPASASFCRPQAAAHPSPLTTSPSPLQPSAPIPIPHSTRPKTPASSPSLIPPSRKKRVTFGQTEVKVVERWIKPDGAMRKRFEENKRQVAKEKRAAREELLQSIGRARQVTGSGRGDGGPKVKVRMMRRAHKDELCSSSFSF
ncbi:MAG: hypothetical protein M1834_001206 [Cirrosporium novae-zelandiae]|nr:MAG: hypothetical protein M1834_001206 [Cirrosporium novae-zelandiae]